jgi:hypothetical protein
MRRIAQPGTCAPSDGQPVVRHPVAEKLLFFATAWKRPLNAVKLAHANAPFERAADRSCDFGYFDSARSMRNVNSRTSPS